MEELLDILQQIKPQVNYESEKNLIEDGLIDSFDIVVLIGMINDEFGVNIPISKIKPENLNSLEAIAQLIESCRK